MPTLADVDGKLMYKKRIRKVSELPEIWRIGLRTGMGRKEVGTPRPQRDRMERRALPPLVLALDVDNSLWYFCPRNGLCCHLCKNCACWQTLLFHQKLQIQKSQASVSHWLSLGHTPDYGGNRETEDLTILASGVEGRLQLPLRLR